MSKNKYDYKVAIILLLSACLLVFGLILSSNSKKINDYQAQSNELSNLLQSTNGPRGFSCAVLNPDVAKELLQVNDVKNSFGQLSSYTIKKYQKDQENMFWTDNCRYVDSQNSNKYIELYINTFTDYDAAKKAFPDFKQLVDESEHVVLEKYEGELLYDGGSLTYLTDNRVIQIAASNGNSSELKEFSMKAFMQLIDQIL
jgi:hypothetical protein